LAYLDLKFDRHLYDIEPKNSIIAINALERDYLNIRKIFTLYYLRVGGADFLKEIELSPYIQENFLEKQIIPDGPFYRGILLESIPKVGDVFKSNYSGWLLNKKTAKQYTLKSSEGIKVIVCSNYKDKVLLSVNSFGPLVQSQLQSSDFLYRKITDRLFEYKDAGQDELIIAPFNSKIKSVEVGKYNTYYIEV